MNSVEIKDNTQSKQKPFEGRIIVLSISSRAGV